MGETDLTKGRVSTTLFRFAILLAATFLKFLYAVVDMIVVAGFPVRRGSPPSTPPDS